MLTHMHPAQAWFACKTSPNIKGPGVPALSLGQTRNRQVPRASLPASGVTSGGEMSRISSEGVTPPSSLISTHAPDQTPPADFGCPYFGRSSQVAVSPCWKMALPDVISTVCVKALGPVPRRVPGIQSVCAPFLLGQGTGIPGHRPRYQSDTLGTRNIPCNATSTGGCLSGLQSFTNVQAPLLARPPGCTYRCDTHRAARPFTSRNEHGVTRLDRSRFSMNCDIATYPKRTN
jgi:hypothetical protein